MATTNWNNLNDPVVRAEIQKKALAGTALSNATPEKQALYNQFKAAGASNKTPAPNVAISVPLGGGSNLPNYINTQGQVTVPTKSTFVASSPQTATNKAPTMESLANAYSTATTNNKTNEAITALSDLSTVGAKTGTPTTITRAGGAKEQGYIVDGQTFDSTGNRIKEGDSVTVNGITYKMGADGKGVEVKAGAPAEVVTPVETKIDTDTEVIEVNGKKITKKKNADGTFSYTDENGNPVNADGSPIKSAEEDFLATWMKYATGSNDKPDYTAEAEAKAAAEKALIQNSLDNLAKQQGLDAEALAQQTEQSRQLLSQKGFQSYLAARQGLANRGLSGSGLAADVNARLGMANNQELANLFTKANTESNQIMKNYNDKLSELRLKKDQITSAKYKAELEKLWQDTQNTMADNLAKIAPYITMTASQKASAATAAQNADTNAMNARTKQANTYGFALDASGNPLYDANGNLIMTTSGRSASLAERKWLSEAYGYVMNDDGTFVHDPATGRPITTVEKQKVDAQIKKWADDTSMDLKELEAKVTNWTAQNKIKLSSAQTAALNATINAAKVNNKAEEVALTNSIKVAKERLKTARDIVLKRLTNLQDPSKEETAELTAAQAELNKVIGK